MEIVFDRSELDIAYRKHLVRAIELIGVEKFDGVQQVVVRDSINLDALTEEAKSVIDGYRVSGYYYPAGRDGGALIELYATELMRGIPGLLLRTPITTLRIVAGLGHELAHHLISQKNHRLMHDQEEKLANRYARSLVESSTKRRTLRFWGWALKELASWHFAAGRADFRLGNLENAINHCYTAWQLNPRDSGAAAWFWYLRSLRGETEARRQEEFARSETRT